MGCLLTLLSGLYTIGCIWSLTLRGKYWEKRKKERRWQVSEKKDTLQSKLSEKQSKLSDIKYIAQTLESLRGDNREFSDFLKTLRSSLRSLDASIDNKVNAGLVKQLSIKWQSLTIIILVVLSISAMQNTAFFYVNDRFIKSSEKSLKSNIEKHMSEYKYTLDNLQGAVKDNKDTVNKVEKSLKHFMTRQFKKDIENYFSHRKEYKEFYEKDSN